MAKLKDSSKLHLAMFPWVAMGHMTPFLHLSNELAARGHPVSFLLPKKAQTQLQHLNLHPSLITFHHLTIPHVNGLPAGAETASDVPLPLSHHLAAAFNLTRDQVQQFLLALKPDIVLFDIAYWVPELTSALGIKSVCYYVVCAASIALSLTPASRITKEKPMTEPPPGYPSSTVVLRGNEYRSLGFLSMDVGGGVTIYDRIMTGNKQSDAIAIRTCGEVEQNMCDYIAAQYSKPVLLTGTVLPEPDETPLEGRWATWLGRFEPGSVVYCALGSQLILQRSQFQELVLGLEMSGQPFFAALKPPFGVATIDEALPEGFEERTRERGVVYGGWVQQTVVLNHPSVGCFVSHCGFGSMWESLVSDSQIVLVPHLGDQILNTRLLDAELKVGMEVERDENGGFTKESLSKAIMCVMDGDSEVGALLKKNHLKWKETLTSPNFKSNYIDMFIQNLHQL